MMAQKKGGGGGFFGYVEDGLVLMIDGIENSPNGHVDTLTELYDLVGKRSYPIVSAGGNPTIYSDHIYFQGCYASGEFVEQFADKDMCIEMRIGDIGKDIAWGDATLWRITNFLGASASAASFGMHNFPFINWQTSLGTRTIQHNKEFVGDEWRGYEDGVFTISHAAYYGTRPTTTFDLFEPPRTTRYHGSIYNIRIYERALTDAEILANYQNDVARFNL